MDVNSQRSAQESWLTRYLLPLGSVLIAALALLTQNAQLPKWVIVVAVLYLGVVAGVSLYGPGVSLVSFIQSKWRYQSLRRTYSPKLLECIRGLRQLLAQEHSSTVLHVLQEAAQRDELRSRSVLFDAEYIASLRAWLASIERRIKRYQRNDFSDLCREVGDLVFQYDRLCCQGQRVLQEAIAAGELPEQRLRSLKQRWNVQREGHATFIRTWTDFSKKVNDMAGGQLCIDYYEPLGTLE